RGRASAATAGLPAAAAEAAQNLMKARRSMRRIVSPELKPLERRDVLGVEAENPFPAIGEPVPQGRADRAKGDLLPGNPFLVEEGHLEGLFTGPRSEEHTSEL